MDAKTVRREVTDLWNDAGKAEECDRVFIALHRFQTEDKIAYRRLVGMHGGGGGTSDATSPGFLQIMKHFVLLLEGRFYAGFKGGNNSIPHICGFFGGVFTSL